MQRLDTVNKRNHIYIIVYNAISDNMLNISRSHKTLTEIQNPPFQ